MIGALIGIILTLIVAGVIYWGILQLLPMIPLPDPFGRIVHVLLVILTVIIVIWVLIELLGMAGVRVPLFHG